MALGEVIGKLSYKRRDIESIVARFRIGIEGKYRCSLKSICRVSKGVWSISRKFLYVDRIVGNCDLLRRNKWETFWNIVSSE